MLPCKRFQNVRSISYTGIVCSSKSNKSINNKSINYKSINYKRINKNNNTWNLPDLNTIVQNKERRINKMPPKNWRENKELEEWKRHKYAMKEKYPDGYKPIKKLSLQQRLLIKEMYNKDKNEFNFTVLSEYFKVSPESIRRIVSSSWEEISGSVDGMKNSKNIKSTKKMLNASKENTENTENTNHYKNLLEMKNTKKKIKREKSNPFKLPVDSGF